MKISQPAFSRFIQGYADGFEVIFESYLKVLIHYAMQYGVSKDAAEDVVMEVFHKIWNLRDKINSPEALNSLLYISVRNRALNTLRDSLKTETIECDLNIIDDDTNSKIIEEECYNAIYNAISSLSTQAQSVILQSMEGKSIADIANSLDISESSVKTYKRRAITYLSKSIKNQYTIALLLLYID